MVFLLIGWSLIKSAWLGNQADVTRSQAQPAMPCQRVIAFHAG
jgi:hypothetical protein